LEEISSAVLLETLEQATKKVQRIKNALYLISLFINGGIPAQSQQRMKPLKPKKVNKSASG
jgi:hypothetical protein